MTIIPKVCYFALDIPVIISAHQSNNHHLITAHPPTVDAVDHNNIRVCDYTPSNLLLVCVTNQLKINLAIVFLCNIRNKYHVYRVPISHYFAGSTYMWIVE
jgi:hypothetical protein